MSASASPLHQVQPSIFVIFGITGDLSQRFLLPALYHLLKEEHLDERTVILGASRRELDIDDLLNKVKLFIEERDGASDEVAMKRLRTRLKGIKIDPDVSTDYDLLNAELQAIEDQHGTCMNRIFYLAIPSQVYQPMIEQFGAHGLNKGCSHNVAVSRLMVEKPFGYDMDSAVELLEHTAKYFSEDQTFRVDHYLAKETVQNILFFRTHNPVFSGLWNREHISKISIEAREKLGVEGRGNFYENIGALRDIVQNHLIQVMSLVTMEPIESVTSDAIHEAKQRLFEAIRTVDIGVDTVVRGQYRGYRDEVKKPDSDTETFVSVGLQIDNDRWRGVPITITTGKALAAKYTGITVTFTRPERPSEVNELTFRIQPNEGIHVNLVVKRPGFHNAAEAAPMDFSFASAFRDVLAPAAYERVLLDGVRGSKTLFASNVEVIEAWRVVQPIIDAAKAGKLPVVIYEPGSDGPNPAA